MLRTAVWVRTHATKIDRTLRHRLIGMYRPYKWLPCFLHKFLYLVRAFFIKHQVIVKFWDDVRSNEVPQFGTKKKDLSIINGSALKLSANKMIKLLQTGSVERIWLDGEVSAIMDVATPSIHAPELWQNSYTGKGVGIAVVDTGVYRHPDFTEPENRIVAFKDFVKNRSTAYDDNGHGTHCAGIAVGNGISSKGKYKGIAYDANIIGVKVLTKQGSGSLSTVIEGIQWCVENKDTYNIRIISLSLGAPTQTDPSQDPMCITVSKAWSEGIVVCVAAGNEGPEQGTIGSPAIDPDIITVGALDDRGTIDRDDDVIAGFSSRGPTISGEIKPDLVTPGVDIISLRSPNSYMDKYSSERRVGKWYFSLSGTSMATPICAGAVALMLEANPLLTPEQVKQYLMEGVDDLGYPSTVQGAGYVHMGKVLTYLLNKKVEQS